MVLPIEYVSNLETRMQAVQVRHYANLLKNLWWQKVAKVRNIVTGRELIAWMLDTAKIERLNHGGGNTVYSDLVMAKLEVTSDFAGASFEMDRAQLEDLDPQGIAAGVSWAQQIATHAAYWPQKEVARALIYGDTSTDFVCFDGKQLFAKDHPLNYREVELGSFANLFSGSASDSYPGALPIHGADCYSTGAVTTDVALQNLSTAVGYVRSIPCANGEDPANLEPVLLGCSPRLYPRACQLTQAKFIAQAAAGGTFGGSADVEAIVASLGLVQPVMMPELALVDNGTTWFIGVENAASPEVGGIIYANRESFATRYYTGRGGDGGWLDRLLDRTDKLEWHCKGRNGVFAGMPDRIFKFKRS